MQNAIAFCDNDVVVVAWSYGAKLAGCMGFAVYRIDAAGVETALPSMAVFRETQQVSAAEKQSEFAWLQAQMAMKGRRGQAPARRGERLRRAVRVRIRP